MVNYTGLSLPTMNLIIPILNLLTGYAVQNEPVKSYALDKGEIVEIQFPAMKFSRVKAPSEKGGFAWALMSSSNEILAIIMPKA